MSVPSSTSTNNAPALLVLAGPAGSGKSTLCDRVVHEVPGFERVITTTTRAPRPGEVNGVHYHFLTPAQFDAKIAAGEFLEWAWVHGERRYGTLKASVIEPLSRGQSLAINLDVQGVDSLRRAAEQSPALKRAMAAIFILLDHEQLVARIRGRGQDDDAEIARRMATAEAELLEAPKFEFVIHSASRNEDFAALLKILAIARARAA
ncbi:MAG: guanylate kinase [Undibacterium sp.]|nr:guanylate kinase [Opitutaceae bacterium]